MLVAGHHIVLVGKKVENAEDSVFFFFSFGSQVLEHILF
jgi:hypothetical protein